MKDNMDRPSLYEIRVEEHLTDRWTDWFEGLSIRNDPDGGTTISGMLIDQVALMGLLNKVQTLNLKLISVNRLTCHEDYQHQEVKKDH